MKFNVLSYFYCGFNFIVLFNVQEELLNNYLLLDFASFTF